MLTALEGSLVVVVLSSVLSLTDEENLCCCTELIKGYLSNNKLWCVKFEEIIMISYLLINTTVADSGCVTGRGETITKGTSCIRWGASAQKIMIHLRAFWRELCHVLSTIGTSKRALLQHFFEYGDKSTSASKQTLKNRSKTVVTLITIDD